MDIQIKRVYEKAEREDGYRVLVDRIWPRGMTKEQACADLWLKEIAPSTSLRKWFRHDQAKWNEFKKRYFTELDVNKQTIEIFLKQVKNDRLTLLYSAKDTEYNQAAALREYLIQNYPR